jgi:hypothetical protein
VLTSTSASTSRSRQTGKEIVLLASHAQHFPGLVKLIGALAGVLVAAGGLSAILNRYYSHHKREQEEFSEPSWRPGDPFPPARDFDWGR